MTKDGNRAWDLRQPLDIRDVGCKGDLLYVSHHVTLGSHGLSYIVYDIGN